jgi:hypothetical protein
VKDKGSFILNSVSVDSASTSEDSLDDKNRILK